MDPVLGSLPDEILLRTTRGGITPHGIPLISHKIIEARQPNNKGIVVVLEERLRVQTSSKHGFQVPASAFLSPPSVTKTTFS